MSKFAWVTLTTNDTYSLGALVLAHSLRRACTQHQLAVLVTPGVSESMREKLKDVYNIVQEVNVMDSQDAANLALLSRPELGITFTKLHCWRLVQFEKCVFLDSDTLVLQNCDELFEREEFSAAPDVSWPDCFNSGVFVYKPSQETFDKIVAFALKNGSFDGGDQGLLNQYFSDWAFADMKKRLPFLYNVTAYASYCYLPAFKQFRDKIKILHFAGKMKPWLIHYNTQSRMPSVPSDYAHASDLIQLWWNIFFDNVHKDLNKNMRYYCAPLLPWKSNYDIYIVQKQQNEQREQLQQQQHEQHQYDLYDTYEQQLNANFQEEYENTQEFHDPWEDYYKKQEEMQRQQQQQQTQQQHTEYEQHFENEQHHAHSSYSEEQCNSNKSYSNINEDQYKCHAVVDEHHDSAINVSSNTNTDQYDDRDCGVQSIVSEAQSTCFSSSNNKENPANLRITESIKDLEACSNIVSNRDTEFDSCTDAQACSLQDYCENDENVDDDDNDDTEAGLAAALSQVRLGEQSTPEQDAYDQLMRRQCWESGQIDYTGLDSFDNIWKRIQQTLEDKPTKSDESSNTGSS